MALHAIGVFDKDLNWSLEELHFKSIIKCFNKWKYTFK